MYGIMRYNTQKQASYNIDFIVATHIQQRKIKRNKKSTWMTDALESDVLEH